MTKKQRIEIVEELVDEIRHKMLTATVQMPEHWNGLQIRRYFVDKAQEQNAPRVMWSRQNERDYLNDLMEKGL